VNKLLGRLTRLVRSGLEATAPFWPSISAAYAFGHRAAHVLANPDQLDRPALQRRYGDLMAEFHAAQDTLGALVPAAAHFLKVTASYWPGLFACYGVADLPRTNNGLEQYFGSARHAERRATGRRGASPALVVRGAVRVVAAVATHLHAFTAAELRPRDIRTWASLRQQVTARHDTRRLQARFRRDPLSYLAALEDRLVAKPALPS
jgi:hypothetical protein